MKTSDLAGAELDCLIAKIEQQSSPIIVNNICTIGLYGVAYRPSTHWSQGGPLIEKYIEELTLDTDIGKPKIWTAWIPERDYKNPVPGYLEQGETPLIAAMRAIVASVYGDSVDE